MLNRNEFTHFNFDTVITYKMVDNSLKNKTRHAAICHIFLTVDINSQKDSNLKKNIQYLLRNTVLFVTLYLCFSNTE